MSLLRVENLTYTYNPNTPFCKDAIVDVSFTAEKGEIIGIIGHTGSGKSTLVQHLNGLLKATDGKIFYNERDIWENPKEIRNIRSKIGLVFQYPEYQLFDETVYKDIAFGPKNMGLSENEIEKAVRESAVSVEIPADYLEKSPFDLSGGEKRRVAIAGVLAMKPEIIVFDEPTAGLDPQGRATVMDIIKKYRDKNNATVFVVSHSMEDMAMLADKILVLNKGSVVMFDTPKNVFSKREELKKIGLDVPQITKIIHGLIEKGIDLPRDIITVDEAVAAILNLRKGGGLSD